MTQKWILNNTTTQHCSEFEDLQMTLEKWRDWMELIALIAVVGSLLALVVELRQTQTAMRAQAYQARALDGIAWNFEVTKDNVIRELQDKLEDPTFDLETLTPIERSIARRLITIVRIDLDNEHFQYQSGLLDPSFYNGETVSRIRQNAPIWREFGMISPRQDFRAEVDRILRENQ